jgi:hypothetical protein
LILDLLRLRVNGSLGNTKMSKYNKLLGLAKEVLPSGERVLVREGDDLFRQLKGLDDREIETIVSEMDAIVRAGQIKRDLINKLAPDSSSERMNIRKKFNDSYMTGSPLSVASINFPEEYASHLDPEEIDLLSKQFKNNATEQRKVFSERHGLQRNLNELNPTEFHNIFDSTHSFELNDIAKERFKKIRDAMKDKK